jgi:outer membrane cobalamin receptor
MLGGPIARASVILNGRVATVTDAAGFFQIYGVGRGLNLIETRRLGYVPGAFEIDIEPNRLELEMTVGLYPAPVQLDEIVVSASRTVYVAPRLREFYERRSAGWGSYFVRWEIENLAPISTTDLLQRVPGLLITHGGFGFTDIRVARGAGDPCTPRIFLDGVRMRVDSDFNLDNFVSPFELEGIEVYTGPSQTPLAYLGESSCGVILIWTQ